MSDIKEGQIVRFKGYGDDVSDPILTAGELVKVRTINPDGGMIMDRIDQNGDVLATDAAETLFVEEVDILTDDEVLAILSGEVPSTEEAEAAPAKEAPKKTNKKSSKTADTEAPAPAPVTEGEDAIVVNSSSALVRQAIASVSSEDGQEQQAALIAAKSLINRVDETYYTLGGVLSYVKETGVYKSLGFDGKRGFVDYCKNELGIDYRKAQYLINVFNTVQTAGLNENRLAEIGWSKAVQIMRVADVSQDRLTEDFDTLIEFAKTNSRDDLITHIKTTYEGIATRAAASGEQVKVNVLTFKASAEEAEQMERALGNAKRLAGTDDANAALRYILNDWLMMTDGTDIDAGTAIATVEARFGIKLEVVDGLVEDASLEAEVSENEDTASALDEQA